MHRWTSRQGFTLIEMIVVIAIIGLLAAILFPVFSTAREKARQTKCKSQLMQLVTALNQFRQANGRYPGAPEYNPGAGRYVGGFSALYPDYVQELDLLICPNDQEARVNLKDCHDRVYCSYNGIIDWVDGDGDGETWEFLPFPDSPGVAILYNYYGYTYQFKLDPDDPRGINEIAAADGWSSGYDTDATACILPSYLGVPPWMDIYLADGTSGSNGIPDFLDVARLSWQHFPGLANRSAPDYTIVSHCPHHRRYFDPGNEMDMIVTLTGEASSVNVTNLCDPAETGVPDGSSSTVAAWVHQNF